MEKSIKILEDLSSHCSSEQTRYKFSKQMMASDKYRKGRIDALNWINDIIFHFIQKEKNFISEFKQHIKEMIELIIGSSITVSAIAIYFYFRNKHSDTKKIPFSDTLTSSKIIKKSKD